MSRHEKEPAHKDAHKKTDSLNRASLGGIVLTDLQLDLLSCGPTREWVMVEPKPVAPRSRAGRPKTKPNSPRGGRGASGSGGPSGGGRASGRAGRGVGGGRG